MPCYAIEGVIREWPKPWEIAGDTARLSKGVENNANQIGNAKLLSNPVWLNFGGAK